LRQRRPRLLQLLLRRFPFRQVAGDLGKADRPACGIADRVDDAVRPKPRAVFAHPPAFALEPALARRRRQPALRQTCCLVLLRIEDREVPADDFLAAVSLDPLAAEITISDIALRSDQ